MCHFWQAGTETMENITFGERPLEKKEVEHKGTFGELLDFQGVFSPVYAINAIGSVLTRKGEGLIGFNFDLWGDPDSPKVLVNPFSVLTPGMFREIFRRPPPKVELDK